MKIHEYQAKEILAGYRVPVPRGGVAATREEAAKVAAEIGGRVVVKAQVHAGGRGKAGGIKLVSTPEEAAEAAGSLLGTRLVTPQTGPEGVPIGSVLIEEAVATQDHCVGVHLSRNFGHQAAISAGLKVSRGEAVALIDGDLQDPPELIPQLYAKVAESYDVVYAVRRNRKEGWIKRACYFTYYRMLNKITLIDLPLDAGDYCVMSRRVVTHINQMPERNRYIRGLRSFVGFKQTGIPYDRGMRVGGTSKYTLNKL